MPMIQIAKIQNSFLRIFRNMVRIVNILVKFTVHIFHIDLHGAKIVIDELHKRNYIFIFYNLVRNKR